MNDEPSQVEGLERWMKLAIVVYVLLLVGIVGAYIGIATLDIENSAYITGPKTLVANQPNALRGFVLDAPTGRMIRGAKANFELVAGGERSAIGEATSERHGYFHASVEPAAEASDAKLAVTIRSPRFDEPYQAEVPIDVEASRSGRGPFPKFDSRLPTAKRDWRKHLKTEFDGELQVDAFPPNGELVRGLSNTVWLRLTRKQDGAPVRGTIVLEEISGQSAEPLRKTHETDELGFVPITFKPIGSHRWTVRAQVALGEEPQLGTGELAFTTVPAQFSMSMRNHVVAPGDVVTGMVDTLYRSGGFMVDLHDPDHWIGAEAYGIANNQGGFQVQVPRTEPGTAGLFRVQVYESVFQPGNAWDSRYVLHADEPGSASCRDALDGLLDELARQEPAHWGRYRETVELPATMQLHECNEWAAALLASLPRSFTAPTMLVNTQQSDRAELEEWKDDVQAILLIAVIIALLIGLATILVVVFSSSAESARQRGLMEAEMADFDEEFISMSGAKLERLAHGMRIVIIVGTLILFGVGVVLILSFL